MTVQLAYVASQLGNTAEALSTYEVHFSSLLAMFSSHNSYSTSEHPSDCISGVYAEHDVWGRSGRGSEGGGHK